MRWFKFLVLALTVLLSAGLYFLLLVRLDWWKKVVLLRGDLLDYLYLFALTTFWVQATKLIWRWEVRVLFK